jgi:hypothetical protein
MAGPNSNANEPYGFSISYSQSVDNLVTILTGYKRVPKKDPTGAPLPGEYDDIMIPNSFPILTREGGVRLRSVLEMNMDKFNPIGNQSESDCAEAAWGTEITLADQITINADKYLYEYDKDPSTKLGVWDAYLEDLARGLYRFASLAKKGHFINFAGKIMNAGYDTQGGMQEPPRGLRALFSKPRKDVNPNADMYG